jgi:hypothetical protein
MAGNDQLLFKIDTIVVNGVPLAIEDGTGVLSGAARFQNNVVPSASGPDFNSRKRVPQLLKCNLQFGPGVDPAALPLIDDATIAARDSISGRRALMHQCTFGEMGDVGAGGAVPVTFNIMNGVEWM